MSFSIKLFLSFLGFVLIIIAILGSFLIYSLQPASNSQDTQKFTINPGESVSSIATRLQDQGFIKNASAFKFAVAVQGISKKIQAGNFFISPNMPALTIAQNLTSSVSDDIQVTLLEGWRREEFAQALDSTLPSSSAFDPEEFITLTAAKEGMLYPDTYRFAPAVTTQEVISILEQNFAQKVANTLDSQLNSSPYSLNQILTMASIVEREARGDDRKIVAGILWKRLQNDWPLQADATLQYIKARLTSSANNWWPTPLSADKDLDSPYNTYKYQGLPPLPICNPSLSSIQASLEPLETDYWYYLTDLSGKMHYSQTYDQHLQNINTYLR